MSLSLLQVAANAATVAKSYSQSVQDAKLVNSKSWIDFTSVTDIEPLVLIDSDIRHEKIMEAVQQMALKTYMSYYLRAASMLSNLKSVEMLRRLDMLNPNRKIEDSLFDIGQPVFEAVQAASGAVGGSMEDAYHLDNVPSVDQPYLDFEYFTPVQSSHTAASLEADDKKKVPGRGMTIGDELKGMGKKVDQSTGQSAKVKFSEDGTDFDVHVNFRLATYTEDRDVIVSTFSIGSKRNTAKERKHRYKSGELTFADRYFFRDIIKTHRNTLIKSKTNFYQDTLRRRSNQQVTNVMKQGASTAEISGGIVISARTAVAIEREIGGPLSDFATRENALDKVSAMLLIVVDPDKEEVILYRYSVREVVTMDFYSLKDSNDKGPDMMDLMKSINIARR